MSPLPRPYRQVVPLLVVFVAGILSRLFPSRLRAVLEFTRCRVAPATADQAAAARAAVVAVSLRCAGQACLQRSVATALLCRVRGTWHTWCTGVRANPFSAHAWVEVEGAPVGERIQWATSGSPVGRACRGLGSEAAAIGLGAFSGVIGCV
ncbi:lasso peptide biosynthesis B2 protein [Streptomyces olivaceus]|uniref:lasso peptide biosynthesis B2 protein n=2 Tax=Streptomyces TaxID=1883 RepID=UPI003676BC55